MLWYLYFLLLKIKYSDVPEGWNHLQIEVVSENPEQPGVIGGARVNLNEAFAEGRSEEWVSIMGRDFEPIGQVLLNLTFQSFGDEAEGYAGAAPYNDEKPMPPPPEYASRSVDSPEEEEEKKVPDWVVSSFTMLYIIIRNG